MSAGLGKPVWVSQGLGKPGQVSAGLCKSVLISWGLGKPGLGEIRSGQSMCGLGWGPACFHVWESSDRAEHHQVVGRAEWD